MPRRVQCGDYGEDESKHSHNGRDDRQIKVAASSLIWLLGDRGRTLKRRSAAVRGYELLPLELR